MPYHPQFKPIFQLIPAPSMVLLPDAPKFTIVAVNNAYLEASNSTEKDLIGKGIFEAFPENPENKVSKSVENLRNSLEFVIDFKEKHKMAPQQYDISIRGTSGFKVKYFNPQNIPLLDDDGNITHILHSVEDVTDKKNLELSLEIERQRFNDLYFQAPSCMGILKGPDHVYELANPLYLELIGAKDIIGKTVKEVLPELETQGILKLLDTVYETGETFSANEMLLKFDHHGNGELVDRYLNFIYQANRNNEGIINGILVFATDVTELVLARKKTEESEKRYKELIQNLPIATVSSDFEGRILLYNKAAVALWGREPDIENDKWCGAWKLYCKNGNPLPDELSPMAIAIKEGRKTSAEEIIVERPNGDKVNVLINPVPYKDSSGKVIGIVNMGIDITESKKTEKYLRESEKKYRQIVETAQEGIWLVDENDRTTFVNDKLCEILEYNRDEMIGKEIYLFMDEDARNKALHVMQRKKEGYSGQFQFKYLSKSGKEVWTYISVNPLFDETGCYKGGLAMVTDITERRKADEELRVLNKELADQIEKKERWASELSFSNKELVKTNKELDRFVYSVSHDLRSPLTSILGLISFIEEDSKEPDTLEHVKMIRTSVNRLDGFIKNILSYSQNNRTDLEVQKIPIKKTIYEIVDSVRNIKEANGISFKVDIDEQYPFYSNWHRFSTVLENLVSNSIKYHTNEVSGRYLKLTGTLDPEELKLSISDNGIGIDPEFHDKIFEMFYRLPGNTEGTGLGLYIVKETVEKMQGNIEIQSEKGIGTTFNIRLKNLKV
ncbi:PAS domain S-box protein [Salegentibacter sp. JZCK2]|uniref:PAS domain S-box protein n=1 Tax=Salegentibacter tibetensis TaxID=2873600 RepID=UPI001CCAC564|nr:PAS domain S-box protein [Salegentibacter tibetensis]MBZ9730372.1 PAS domain S-box protein [Salegentibacter tibetensis]